MENKKIKIPPRSLFNGQHYFVDEQKKVVKLEENYHKKLLSRKPGSFGSFKKLSGTYLGDVLELSPFHSQFRAFAKISGFAMPILDPKYVNAGKILEPKIIEKIETKLKSKIKRYDAKEYNYDAFKENHLFGGLPDGYVEDKNLIIEIKTVNKKKLEAWNNGEINPEYLKQSQLYSYLIGANWFTIVACFLEDEDYAKPEWLDINQRILKNWNYEVNRAQVEDDMKKCEEWYRKYTTSGESPIWNNYVDVDLVKYLKCKNFEQWQNLYLEWVEMGKAVPEYEEE
ncbi:hypothetical protein OF364_00990 [Mycoplasma enhydrae]|uniref:MAGa7180 family putative nuclease n=1 Tax=Mycoplasma enhydrae TaxID=2499220 RepID=UPI00197C7305|nr:YqaJ viral recombinase family protein [Mycoplasma enhydrae]MBN4089527.1 hypothetical protein [Mycoplasma enhydrae]MCV3733628.1 hypothetical protein [Mycoplasma enhydrae]MCV3753391.1 hypothetical protein [Mycoplasma enhydrae]